jgi:hypothetical protein
MVLCALGCRRPDAARSPGYAYDDDYAYDYAGYAEEREYGGEFRRTVSETTVSRAAPAKSKARFDKKAEAGAPPSEAPDELGFEASEPAPAPDQAETGAETATTPTAGADRQIIYTAGMRVSVFDVEAGMLALEAIPERHGGWIDSRSGTKVVLRVPAELLRAILDEIAEYGVVESKTLEALDVTAQYVDLDSRIRVLERMQAHLQALLEQAANVEQALEIQLELARVTAELEQLRSQMRLLAGAIAFSTLIVELVERGPTAVEPSQDPFPWVDKLGAEATAYR